MEPTRPSMASSDPCPPEVIHLEPIRKWDRYRGSSIMSFLDMIGTSPNKPCRLHHSRTSRSASQRGPRVCSDSLCSETFDLSMSPGEGGGGGGASVLSRRCSSRNGVYGCKTVRYF